MMKTPRKGALLHVKQDMVKSAPEPPPEKRDYADFDDLMRQAAWLRDQYDRARKLYDALDEAIDGSFAKFAALPYDSRVLPKATIVAEIAAFNAAWDYYERDELYLDPRWNERMQNWRLGLASCANKCQSCSVRSTPCRTTRKSSAVC
jgi:hypothetical protein